MYIDLEGVELCREGSISILTLLIDTGIPTGRVYLIDVHTLGARAFNSAGAEGKTLKDILQNKKIPKVFFDVRNASDAMFAHFGVALQGVEDGQLMESATRETPASRGLLSVADIQYLPELRGRLWTRQTTQGRDLVRQKTKKRVAASQRSNYEPHGPDKAKAPWSKEQNAILGQCNYVPPALNDIDDSDSDGGDEWDDDDDYSTSCRDIISSTD